MRLLLIAAMLLLAGCAAPGDDDHDHDHDHSHAHNHSLLDMGDDAPTLTVSATQDAKSGWNVHVETTNWAWAPLAIPTDHVAGQGHGHIFVDGEQVGRVFSDWLHLPALGEGQHEITVSLNANSHEAIGSHGHAIEATTIVTEVARDAMHHNHAAKGLAAEGAPTVTITHVHEDPATVGKDQHKLALVIETTNWAWAPEHASGDHVDGEGHAHVYLDGVKLGRLYGEAYHIGGVCSGEHTVKVTLNSNDHSDLTVDGETIMDEHTFTLDGGGDCAMDGMDGMEDHSHHG